MPTDTLIARPAAASPADLNVPTAPTAQIAPTAPPTRRMDDMPGPRGVPLLGNALQFKPGLLHQQLEAWAAEYGPFYQVRFGRWRTLVVSDHRVVAATLRDRPDGFRRTLRCQRPAKRCATPCSAGK